MLGYTILQILPAPRWPASVVLAKRDGSKVALQIEPVCIYGLVEKGAFKTREIVPFFVDDDGRMKSILDEDVVLRLVRLSKNGDAAFTNGPDLAKAEKLLANIESIEQAHIASALNHGEPEKITIFEEKPRVETVADRSQATFALMDQYGQKLFEGGFDRFNAFVNIPPTTPYTEALDRVEKFARERGCTVKWTN